MRITIWLSIAVFVTTLYWPQLLNHSGLFACVLSLFIFIHWKKYRYLAIVPFTALYFSSFTLIMLHGLSGEPYNDLHEINDAKTQALLQPSDSSENKQSSVGFLSNALINQDNIITVQVRSLINVKNHGYFIANITSINNVHCRVCPIIEMRWFNPSIKVQSGQLHQFKVRLKVLQGKGNPSGFDRQKWRYSENIAYIATIKEHIRIIDSSISLRAVLYEKMLRVTESLPQQGAIIALVFADKSLMSYEDKIRIKELGIAHLFAISGLHIGLLFLFSFVILNAILKRILPLSTLGWSSWHLINVFSFIVCLCYGYISGFSLPTQRALFMLLISLLMLSNKRNISAFDLLVLCLWSILLIDPLAILSSSLWLSFTAMIAILLFIWSVKKTDLDSNFKPNFTLNLTTNKLNFFNKLVSAGNVSVQEKSIPIWAMTVVGYFFKKTIHFIKWLILLQIVLTLFMLPIQLMNFSAVSTFSLVINLIAIPLFSWLIIPLTLLATLLLLVFESAAVALLSLSDYMLGLFLAYANGFTIGYLHLSEMQIQIFLSLFLIIILLTILICSKRLFIVNNKVIGILCFSLISFMVSSVIEDSWVKQRSWKIEVFDVGQGLAVLVQSDGQYLLYDTGPSYPPNYAVAEIEILPYLQARGIQHLDYLFVSHSDNDHAGGASKVEQSLLIKNAYAGESSLMNQDRVVYQQCLTGQSFNLGKLSIKVLSPTKVGKNNNNNSCVLKVTDGYNSLLLTGDISKTVEKKLALKSLQTNQLDLLKADILIAPHHGSATSSSLTFIKMVKPEWVVFSAGYKNRWNFPKQKVVERYQQLHIEQLTSGETGFIRFNVQNQRIEVKTYREDLAAYWYHQQLVF